MAVMASRGNSRRGGGGAGDVPDGSLPEGASGDRPLVSVACAAFNHAPFIRDALEGFRMQRADFPFEVVVHDDASSDGTAEIIRSFQEEHPERVTAVFQRENQYSAGRRIYPDFIWPLLRGTYVAMCDGDDFWTDPRKLVKQVDALRRHPESALCFHPAAERRTDGSLPPGSPLLLRSGERVLSPRETILGGFALPSASMMVHRRVVEDYISWKELLQGAGITDFFLRILAGLHGGAVFLPDAMCVYRRNVPGSWTERMKADWRMGLRRTEGVMEALRSLEGLSGGAFSGEFARLVGASVRSVLRNRGMPLSERREFYRQHRDAAGWRTRIRWRLVYSRPRIHVLAAWIRKKAGGVFGRCTSR